ncbi:alpha/beta fold hydrolase [Seongchinamella sediminis]|uniref:Alpha/beta fold hydrolase n=1 Tax=Seongchinamella sediminis TaxID=2283635 RepID=A0A3L7DXW1_9GAMM|nr:alpha/beta hydrolase [Seongchinamella sediminis]RLQ21459.1 alpha/beta fold hydrolase [Seongchinamella sediminis]
MQKRIRDIDVTYTESGEGEPVVLIHGLAEDRNSFGDVQQRLQDFHTYAYDFRGHGETSLGDADGTLEQLGEDLIAFMETVTGPARCVGYSLGGTIVLWAALERPDLVKQAVVVGTSTVVGSTAAGFFGDRIELIQDDVKAFNAALRDDTKAQIVSGDVDVDQVTRRRIDAVGNGGGYINAARAMIGVHSNPLTPRLSEISCPVEVIGADGDVFCPRKAADIILDGLKHGNYREVRNAGHLVSIDQPAAYASTLRAALTQSEK